MNLLAFSDNLKTIQSLRDAISGSVHTLEQANLVEISSGIPFSNFDGLIIDWKSWQRNAALFKYFGILEDINNLPLMILSSDGKKIRIKLRESSFPLVYSNYPVIANDVLSNLEKLITVSQTQEA